MKYINIVIIMLSVGLIGCTFYTPSYYGVSAAQWQRMPTQQQTVASYAYNTEQAALNENRENDGFNPF